MATAAPTVQLPTSFALSEHRNLRFATLFLLYFAQGLPFGLIDFALPAWLAQNGASAAAIGSVLAMVILPWTFKLAYGLLMDRYAFLAMGRRRPWIIIGQLGLGLGFVAMAFANPGVHQISVIAIFAFALGLSSAVQDVAVDGLAVDILPTDEIERVNGYMFGAQAIGIAVSAALSGYMIAYVGLPAALLTLAAIIAAILVLVLVVRERPGERLLPWTSGTSSQRNLDLHLGAFGPIVRSLFAAMFTKQTLILVPALIAVVAAWGIFLGLAPLFAANVLGWEKAVYSGWSGQASLVAGLAGALFFGLMAAVGRTPHVYCECIDGRGLRRSNAVAPEPLDKSRLSHRCNFHVQRAGGTQRCFIRFTCHAALHSGDCGDTVRCFYGDPEFGTDAGFGLARLDRQSRRHPGYVYLDDSVQPPRRRLCLCCESGAVNSPTK
jgi:MFS family permease